MATLTEIIEGRSRLPVEDEIKAWVADKRRAEDCYLATVRLCDERISAAWQRMGLQHKQEADDGCYN